MQEETKLMDLQLRRESRRHNAPVLQPSPTLRLRNRGLLRQHPRQERHAKQAPARVLKDNEREA